MRPFRIMPQPTRVSEQPFSSTPFLAASFVRVNGKIRAREVRVIGVDGQQLGVHAADRRHQSRAPSRRGPGGNRGDRQSAVCRLVDFGKYRYEIAKKEKESKKHQHASIVKEVQLSPRIIHMTSASS